MGCSSTYGLSSTYVLLRHVHPFVVEITQTNIDIRAWMSNCIHVKRHYVITCTQSKPRIRLQFSQVWMITTRKIMHRNGADSFTTLSDRPYGRKYKIVYGLEWRTVYRLTKWLGWCKHQNNTRVLFLTRHKMAKIYNDLRTSTPYLTCSVFVLLMTLQSIAGDFTNALRDAIIVTFFSKTIFSTDS